MPSAIVELRDDGSGPDNKSGQSNSGVRNMRLSPSQQSKRDVTKMSGTSGNITQVNLKPIDKMYRTE